MPWPSDGMVKMSATAVVATTGTRASAEFHKPARVGMVDACNAKCRTDFPDAGDSAREKSKV